MKVRIIRTDLHFDNDKTNSTLAENGIKVGEIYDITQFDYHGAPQIVKDKVVFLTLMYEEYEEIK